MPTHSHHLHPGLALALALAIPALIACSSGPAKADAPSSAQMETIKHACTDTMHLRPGNYDYQMCVLSLQQTAASMNAANALQARRQACADRGLAPGSRDFAMCAIAEN
jgi:hypothetical protein